MSENEFRLIRLQSLIPTFFVALSMMFFSSVTAQECLKMHVIHNPPAGYRDASGNIAGIHWDYLTELEKRSEVCMDKRLTSYPRAWKSIKQGTNDGGILSHSAEREPFVEAVAHIITLQTVVIPRKGIILNQYQDLEEIAIARVRGTHLSDRFDHDPNLNLIDVTTYQQAIKMLIKGRVDALAGSSLGLSIIDKHHAKNIVNLEGKYVLGERQLWLALSKNSQHLALIPHLKQAAQTLTQEQTVEKILTKYYGESWQIYNR